MHTSKALLSLLVLVAFLAPTATAALTFNTPESATLPHSSDSALTFSADLTCSDFLDPSTATGEGVQTRTVNIAYPDGVTGDKESITLEFSGASCIGPGISPDAKVNSGDQTITITPGDAAPGKVDLGLGPTSGDVTGTIPFEFEYRMGYIFDDDAQIFPIELSKDDDGEWIAATWTVQLVVTANGDTMVMMAVDPENRAQYGSLSGLFANSPKNFLLEPGAGDMLLDPSTGAQQTMTFSYTPTSDDWEEDHITFTTWSHYFLNGTQMTEPDTVTWTFHNADFEEGGKGLPAPGMVPVALALLGAALVAARRRA